MPVKNDSMTGNRFLYANVLESTEICDG